MLTIMTDRPLATRASWSDIDTNGPFDEIPWRAAFSSHDFERIRRGSIPQGMEDKWFVFFEEPNLFLLRSWTGFCIYRVTFTRNGDAVVAQQAVVSANERQYRRSSDDSEVAHLESLVRGLLLDEWGPVPDWPSARR
jgi:hypothetical protein